MACLLGKGKSIAGDLHNLMKKNTKKIYLDMVLAVTGIILFTLFFTLRFQKFSQTWVLDTLAEISSVSVRTVQSEVSRNVNLLTNLATYIEMAENTDPEFLLNKLKGVNDRNQFKRMGLIMEDWRSYTTDSSNLSLTVSERAKRFTPAMNGETTISDVLLDLVDHEPVTVYATPVYFRDGTHCVLFGTYSSEYYRKTLSISTFSGMGYNYIIRENGDCITDYNTPDDNTFNNFYDKLLHHSPDNGSVVQTLKQAIQKKEQGVLSYDIDDTTRYMYYQSLDINDWYLLSVVPEQVISVRFNRAVRLSYSMLLSCMALLLFFGYQLFSIRAKSRKQLDAMALTDSVTGLGSYLQFRVDAKELLARHTPASYAVVYFNIRKFQYINDLYGYEEGNHVLKKMADCLHMALSPGEISARIQADQFVSILQYDDLDSLEKRVMDIIREVQDSKDHFNSQDPYKIALNAGIYPIEDRNERLDIMIDCASLVTRKEYRNDQHPCRLYDSDLRNRLRKSKELEDMFESALASGEFQMYYQPKYNLKTHHFDGAEALIRWFSPKKGTISPAVFIPILENSSYIIDLDEFVFETACRQIRSWLDEGLPVSPISINVSQLHLYRVNFVEHYLEVIRQYQIPPSLVQIELTETALFDDNDSLKDILETFRQAGICILMDDFGSGYSSIYALRNMPIDMLKIDKTMVDGLESNTKIREIINTVITLAHTLNLKVVIEGVELKEQFEALERMEADYIQGFYCSRPMPADQYRELLASDGTP